MKSVVVINPGSTSTKLAIFTYNENETNRSDIAVRQLTVREIIHTQTKGDFFHDLTARMEAVKRFITAQQDSVGKVTAVAARGGLLKPLVGGVYKINNAMVADLMQCKYGRHASNMGAPIAFEIAKGFYVDAFIAYPVVVDELDDMARVTGMPEITRKSIFHALNQKSVAHHVAEKLGKEYKELTLIVAHLGGGITIGIHVNGKVVDVNNGLDGDGPFSVERAGNIPPGDLLRLCMSNQYTFGVLYKKLVGEGGIVAYLGTKDARLIEKALRNEISLEVAGVTKTKENIQKLLDAWAYQVAKHICALAAYSSGQIDAIIITGGLANFHYFVDEIRRRVKFLGKVFVIPGEDEMKALALYTVRALMGIEKIYEYRGDSK